MVKLKPCPMEGCTQKWLLITGLGQHLFKDHNKSDMIKYILRAEAALERSRGKVVVELEK